MVAAFVRSPLGTLTAFDPNILCAFLVRLQYSLRGCCLINKTLYYSVIPTFNLSDQQRTICVLASKFGADRSGMAQVQISSPYENGANHVAIIRQALRVASA